MGDWQAGTEFDGYRLVRSIGQGGMGQVFLAHDLHLDRAVAIKRISESQADATGVARFLVEARSIARLQHPNVVSVYRVGQRDGSPYLVSEYVRGQALSELPRPQPPARVLRLALGIARGLAAAHRRGVIHRGLKPANVMLADDDEPKLLDFGIAKLVQDAGEPRTDSAATLPGAADAAPLREAIGAPPRSRADDQATAEIPGRMGPAPALSDGARESATTPADALVQTEAPTTPIAPTPFPLSRSLLARDAAPGLTHLGVVMGTPAYVAPEVWLGAPASFASDVYALGVVLFELCTGRPPHSGADAFAIANAAIDHDAPRLDALDPSTPKGLADLVARCLQRDPSGRFAHGDEVRAAVERLLDVEPAAPAVPTNPYRGLHAFDVEHRHLFFGREAEIRALLERLRTESLVLVVGDSGVGKSSLCRAGVLSRLPTAFEPTLEWQVVSLVPGTHPLATLAAALAPLLSQSEDDVARLVTDDPGGVGRALRATLGETRGLVVFLDQAEELLTLADPAEAEAVEAVLHWLAVPTRGLRVLATVRADFLARLASRPRFGDDVARALFFLGPLAAERVRDVIVEPARVAGVVFESEALIDDLVAVTVGTDGGLPLLQFALAELWEARRPDDGTIPRAALEAMGGVTGALTRHADTVLASMTRAEHAAARVVLSRLVSSDGTRQRRRADELELDEPARAALRALVNGRLVVARESPEGLEVEIAHEALLSGWTTLARWLTADADARLVRERLRGAVAEWRRLGRAQDALWSKLQLAELDGVSLGPLPPAEAEFLQASRDVQRRRKALRLAVFAGLPLLVVVIWAAFAVQARVRLLQRLGAELTAGRTALAAAEQLAADGQARRTTALALFDQPRLAEAEVAWDDVRAHEARLPAAFSRVAGHAETALLLAAGRSEVRGLLADLLYQRAVNAERQYRRDEADELLARLALYDDDGGRRRAWSKPARVRSAGPEGARLALRRVTTGEGERYGLAAPTVIAAGADVQLEPGSYVLEVEAPGRAAAHLPFVVERGEVLDLRVTLPPASDVPEGFVVVPAGRFLFGSAAPDGQRRDFFHTAPLHPRTTDSYLIARHETTFREWLDFVEALPPDERDARTPHVDKGGFQGALGLTQTADGRWQIAIQPANQRLVAAEGEPVIFPGRDRRRAQDWRRFPVVGIAVADARAYVAWLAASGRVPGARLCTELEWERAARGADAREFPHGERLAPDDAAFDGTYAKDPAAMGPDEVGSHPASASPFGVDDLAGNVWEWTRSVLEPDGYVARGGSYYYGPNTCRSTERAVTEIAFRDTSVGLRVCADLPTR